MKRYLAIGIGASSGRHIPGWPEEGRIQPREIPRIFKQLGSKTVGFCVQPGDPHTSGAPRSESE